MDSKLVQDIQNIEILGLNIQELDNAIDLMSDPELQLLYSEKLNEIINEFNNLCSIVKVQLETKMEQDKKLGNPIDLNCYRLLKELRNERR